MHNTMFLALSRIFNHCQPTSRSTDATRSKAAISNKKLSGRSNTRLYTGVRRRLGFLSESIGLRTWFVIAPVHTLLKGVGIDSADQHALVEAGLASEAWQLVAVEPKAFTKRRYLTHRAIA